MSLAERLSVVILFHLSGYRYFKYFYKGDILKENRESYPDALSYTRFVALKPRLIMPLLTWLHILRGEKTGIYYIDSTKLEVCHLKRSNSNKLFAQIATHGKTTTGWFFGLKLHLVVNDKGEFMGLRITTGKSDDRPVVAGLMKGLSGHLYADKGYISSKLTECLLKKGIKMITYIRRNMKARLIHIWDLFRLKKRGIIESIFGTLKTNMNLQHTRHRSTANFVLNIFAAIAAYVFRQQRLRPSKIRSLCSKCLIQN